MQYFDAAEKWQIFIKKKMKSNAMKNGNFAELNYDSLD